VKRDRWPETIAKDITRRFIPEYVPEYAKQVAARDASDVRAGAARGACADLSAMVSGRLSDPKDYECAMTWHGASSDEPWGQVKTYDAERFDVEIKGLDLIAAREVLEAAIRAKARKTLAAIDVDAIARDIEALA